MQQRRRQAQRQGQAPAAPASAPPLTGWLAAHSLSQHPWPAAHHTLRAAPARRWARRAGSGRRQNPAPRSMASTAWRCLQPRREWACTGAAAGTGIGIVASLPAGLRPRLRRESGLGSCRFQVQLPRQPTAHSLGCRLPGTTSAAAPTASGLHTAWRGGHTGAAVSALSVLEWGITLPRGYMLPDRSPCCSHQCTAASSAATSQHMLQRQHRRRHTTSGSTCPSLCSAQPQPRTHAAEAAPNRQQGAAPGPAGRRRPATRRHAAAAWGRPAAPAPPSLQCTSGRSRGPPGRALPARCGCRLRQEDGGERDG